ncbi:MAG: tetratricopeptide repeat protein [Acidobacteriia bacterium]|nr:tetratricopeptide repeat protein [Terriglobia bacterium]
MLRVSGSRTAISISGHAARSIIPALLACCFFASLGRRTAAGSDNQADARRLFEEAQAAKARGDLGGAEKKYLEVIRLAPDVTNAYQNLGITYFAEGKYADAASVLEKAVKFSPRLAPAHFMLDLSYYKLY